MNDDELRINNAFDLSGTYPESLFKFDEINRTVKTESGYQYNVHFINKLPPVLFNCDQICWAKITDSPLTMQTWSIEKKEEVTLDIDSANISFQSKEILPVNDWIILRPNQCYQFIITHGPAFLHIVAPVGAKLFNILGSELMFKAQELSLEEKTFLDCARELEGENVQASLKFFPKTLDISKTLFHLYFNKQRVFENLDFIYQFIDNFPGQDQELVRSCIDSEKKLYQHWTQLVSIIKLKKSLG